MSLSLILCPAWHSVMTLQEFPRLRGDGVAAAAAVFE